MEIGSVKLLNKRFDIQLELSIWLAIAALVGLRPIICLFTGESRFIFREYYFELLSAIMIFLFPYLFKLIYSELPFEFLRNKRSGPKDHFEIKSENLQSTIALSNNAINNDTVIANESSIDEFSIIKQHLQLSKDIAQQIYSRSNAYLLVGCLIAFAGVIFFYFQSIAIPSFPERSPNQLLYYFREYLPRIGTLIFVESIAFFFLRQYKTTMEEFRYYEAIKRQRENQLLIAKLSQLYKNNPDYFIKLTDAMKLTENPNKLLSNETTQILETQKISGPEVDVIEKFIDLLKIVKK